METCLTFYLLLRRCYSSDEEQNTKTRALFISQELSSKSPSLTGTSWQEYKQKITPQLHLETSCMEGSSILCLFPQDKFISLPFNYFWMQFNLGDWKGGMVSHRMVVSDGKVGPGTVIKASVLVKQKEEVFYILYFRLEVKELLFFSFFLALKNWMIFFCLLLF